MTSASSQANQEGNIHLSGRLTLASHPIPPPVLSNPHPSATKSFDQVPDPDSKEASDDDFAQLKEAGGGDSKSAAMNRKRIVIKPISDERSRVGTYNKRKFGVIKKAMELSILCNCKIGLFIYSESGKPVRYCSDGDFRSLLNSVVQGSSASSRPGSAEVWDNSMYPSFNRGFSCSGKGDDDSTFDSSLLQASQDMQGGAAKRQCSDSPAGAAMFHANQDFGKATSYPLPLGTVAPPLRVASPLVLSAAATRHNRSQVSPGPSFSPAPMPYSTSLDEFFMGTEQVRQSPFMFEENPGEQTFDALNVQNHYMSGAYGLAQNASFMLPPENDDSASLQSGIPGSVSKFGIQ